MNFQTGHPSQMLTHHEKITSEDLKLDSLTGLQKYSETLNRKIKESQTIKDPKHAEQMITDINQCLSVYSQKYMKFTELLKQNSEVSNNDLKLFQTKFSLECKIVEETITALNHIMESASNISTGSSTSSSASHKRAQAEGAHVRLEFARKVFEIKRKKALLQETNKIREAQYQRQQFEYEAEIELLEYEKEAAAADAEASYLEQVEIVNQPLQNIPLLTHVKEKPVKSANHDSANHQTGLSQRPRSFTQRINTTQNEQTPSPTSKGQEYEIDQPPVSKSHFIFTSSKNNFSKADDSHHEDLNMPNKSELNCLSALFLRKDLITSRLYPFDENPCNFESWKRSFQNAMREMKASPEEELDILTRHLGKESSQYATSIRNANAATPLRGLRLLWERLEDRFGSEMLIENSIRQKLESFPNLTNDSDPKKLYELSDLLDELASIKDNPKYSIPLSFYDSPYGINLIAKKLPDSIREQWTEEASDEEDKNNGKFPTFNFFSDFVRKVSRHRNNPNYAFVFENTEEHPERPEYSEITANKIDFQSSEMTECPIHHTNHPLSTCRAFKSKTWRQRLNYLKENHLCFNCLISTSHSFRSCPYTIKCDTCQQYHNTAMHRKAVSHSLKHDGEELI